MHGITNKRDIAADMLRWSAEQNPPRGRLFKRQDVIAYTGLSGRQVDRLTNGLLQVGGKGTYFYLDVAERLVQYAATRT